MATATVGGATKIKVTLVAAAVIVASFSPYGQRMIKAVGDNIRHENQDRVVFHISFHPEYREAGVHIIGMTEGVEWHNNIHPRQTTIATWAPKGSQSSVNAQQTTNGRLECTATLNGFLVDGNNRQDAGSVRCWVNRKTPDVK